MKHIFVLLAVSFTLLLQACSNDNASTASNSQDDQKSQIEALLDLSGDKGEEFWAAHAAYEAEVNKVLSDHAELAERFNAKYEAGEVDEQRAINMMAEYFRLEAKRVQLKQNYMSTFQSALSTQDVFRLYQVIDWLTLHQNTYKTKKKS